MRRGVRDTLLARRVSLAVGTMRDGSVDRKKRESTGILLLRDDSSMREGEHAKISVPRELVRSATFLRVPARRFSLQFTNHRDTNLCQSEPKGIPAIAAIAI